MTYKYNNVYISNTSTIGGIYEKDGPIAPYLDKVYEKDFYYGEKSFEKAEVKLQIDSLNILLNKSGLTSKDIDVIFAGDLLNQLSASDYAIRTFKIPYMGIFSACATSGEGLIMASTFIDSKKVKNAIVTVSSHNMAAEKQFRNPTEYGTPKPKSATFTVTGAVSILLSNKKSKIKIESSTIGRVIDMGQKDVNNMGAVMAPAAADTIYRHLKDLNRKASYYDLILTGDLGIYGKEILKEYIYKVYDIKLSNYDDCGTMIYDTKKQPVMAGGSGPVCSPLVNFSYIYNKMLIGEYKRVLIVPTGAIFSPTMVFQKESIPAISHAISLELVL